MWRLEDEGVAALGDVGGVCAEAGAAREGYAGESSEVEDFSSSYLLDEEVGDVAVFVVDFVRTDCL